MCRCKNIKICLYFYKEASNMEPNNMYQFIFIPLLVTMLTQVLSKVDGFNISQFLSWFSAIQWNNLFNMKYTICLKGERIRSVCLFSGEATIVESFTNTFSAIWEHILNNNNDDHILEMTELNRTSSSRINNENNTFFYVSQPHAFLVDKKLGIYGHTNVSKETLEKKGNSGPCESYTITIELFSYTTKVDSIKGFLNDITTKYTENIKTVREKNRYIYTIKQVDHEDYYQECWNESIFTTTRSFDNLFFDNKTRLLNQIDFFLHNKEWYYKKGIPYTLGIGLSGEPGTGKTSIIKAIAKYTDRHIVNLSMKLFKTRAQLYKFFFENTYNRKNIDDSITFDKKIIVIEDIDCLGDIVLQRKDVDEKKDNTVKLIESMMEKKDSDKTEGNCEDKQKMVFKIANTDPITLDDILNIWDGIQEHSGRIMIITSNHYDKLDPALTRPGRIDLRMEMSKLSRKSIVDIYRHLYEKNIPRNVQDRISTNTFTPAEIMNMYLKNQKCPRQFTKEICLDNDD